jgi:GNAT superfamily N-acetyltransferase
MAFSRPAALPESADTVAFGCGDDVLDSWLRHRAASSRDAGLSTFVVTDGRRPGRGPQDGGLQDGGLQDGGPHDGGATDSVPAGRELIAGYYCLGTGAVEPIRVSRRRARRPVEPVPTMLVPRLAVDVKFRGQGVGALLLRDAVMRTLTVSRMVGVRMMLAHAPTVEARGFYRHFGFSPAPFDPLVMLLRVRDAAGTDGII